MGYSIPKYLPALLTALVVIALGCKGFLILASPHSDNIKSEVKTNIHPMVYEYDGCQYVRFDESNNGYGAWGSHKGNCTNPIHKKKGKYENSINDN